MSTKRAPTQRFRNQRFPGGPGVQEAAVGDGTEVRGSLDGLSERREERVVEGGADGRESYPPTLGKGRVGTPNGRVQGGLAPGRAGCW